jgi:hypothetical protein
MYQQHDIYNAPFWNTGNRWNKMKKYMTIIHTKNQTSTLNSAELLYTKTAVKMQVLNCSVNDQTQ